MHTNSLSDVLNDLAGGRVVSLAREAKSPNQRNEEDLFAQEDGVFASLSREYRYAREQHTRARKEHGGDSPMAIVAADMEDSAWCAMQTRLMELRSDGALMRHIQKRLWEEECAAQKTQQALRDKKALDFFNRMEAARLFKKNNQSGAVYEWLIVIMLFHRMLRLPFPALGVPECIAA